MSEQASLRFGERRPAERPKPPQPTILTVAELAQRIQGALDQGLGMVWVVGEISNLHPHRSGHCYFTLKDATAQISAVIFRSTFQRVRFRPEDGLEVLAGGRVRLYETQGKVPARRRLARAPWSRRASLAFEQLRDKLAAEGLSTPSASGRCRSCLVASAWSRRPAAPRFATSSPCSTAAIRIYASWFVRCAFRVRVPSARSPRASASSHRSRPSTS